MADFPFVILFTLFISFATSHGLNFTYNGFSSSNLTLDGIAQISSKGLLKLTNSTKQQKGHAFYSSPVTLKNSPNASASSFSTTFVIAIRTEKPNIGGDGIAFVISPTRDFSLSLPSQYLGVFNSSNSGIRTNHIVAVELDTIKNSEFSDINDNHVGIDINGLVSVSSSPASYYNDINKKIVDLSLISGRPIQVWVEYDGVEKQINVTIAPANHKKPSLPLLSEKQDLSPFLLQKMFIGFSSSTGSVFTTHNVLGWSFRINGQADPLSPHLPRAGPKPTSKWLTIGLPVILGVVILTLFLMCCKKGQCQCNFYLGGEYQSG